MLLIYCSTTVNRTEAIIFLENIYQIDDISKKSSQDIIDETTRTLLNLKINSECEINFDHINHLLNIAIEDTQKERKELYQLHDIDKSIGCVEILSMYVDAQLYAFEELEKWYDTLSRTRDLKLINEFNDKQLENFKIMKQYQLDFRIARNEFNQKYKL